MSELRAVNLDQITEGIRKATRPVSILWQADDTLAFVARGREHRSEFHSDPVDEVMYMIKGDMNLHYRTPEGEEKIAVIREGEIIYCPAGVPHSPRFAPDAFVLVLERKRRADERDRFSWFCEQCGTRPLRERQARHRLQRRPGLARLRGVLRGGQEPHLLELRPRHAAPAGQVSR